MPAYVSPDAQDLLRRILVTDPAKRARFEEIKGHRWLKLRVLFKMQRNPISSALTDQYDTEILGIMGSLGMDLPAVYQALKASAQNPLTTT